MYKGGWKDGKQHGEGVMIDEKGVKKKGKWETGTILKWYD